MFGWAQTIAICSFAIAAFLPNQVPLLRSDTVTAVGNIFCFVGIALVLGGVFNLRRVIQIDPAPREDGHLVTSGIHGVFRHPIYTGILLAIIGLTLKKPTPLLVIAAAIVIGYLLVKVRYEERLLTARYPGYAAHKAKTIGVLPGL